MPEDAKVSNGAAIVIPTYNEKQNIIKLINEILLDLDSESVEIIIVDDNSPDGTGQEVKHKFNNHDNIKLLQRKEKRGLATAIFEGFKDTSKDKLVKIDADFQHPPKEIKNIIERLDGSDIVIGSRFLPESIYDDTSPRRMRAKSAKFLTHLVLPPTRSLTDPNSGFFGLKKDVLTNIKYNNISDKFLLEILIKYDGTAVTELPYQFSHRNSGQSKLMFKSAFQRPKSLIKLLSYHIIQEE